MRGAEPGVARVQDVLLNPEIGIVVVEEDNLVFIEGKPTLWNGRKAAVLSCVMASREGHHLGLRTGHVLTGVTRELGRAYCLPALMSRHSRAAG